MITELRNVKIRVNSLEESELFQQIAFACGCEWSIDKKHVIFTEQPFLYVDSEGFITFDRVENEDIFNQNQHQEITLKQLTPPKNADLMALQSKGIGFIFNDQRRQVAFSNHKSDYEVDLNSCFELVSTESSSESRQTKIEDIERQMRILADELEQVRNGE